MMLDNRLRPHSGGKPPNRPSQQAKGGLSSGAPSGLKRFRDALIDWHDVARRCFSESSAQFELGKTRHHGTGGRVDSPKAR